MKLLLAARDRVLSLSEQRVRVYILIRSLSANLVLAIGSVTNYSGFSSHEHYHLHRPDTNHRSQSNHRSSPFSRFAYEC